MRGGNGERRQKGDGEGESVPRPARMPVHWRR
jgi:hypothetical protein